MRSITWAARSDSQQDRLPSQPVYPKLLTRSGIKCTPPADLRRCADWFPAETAASRATDMQHTPPLPAGGCPALSAPPPAPSGLHAKAVKRGAPAPTRRAGRIQPESSGGGCSPPKRIVSEKWAQPYSDANRPPEGLLPCSPQSPPGRRAGRAARCFEPLSPPPAPYSPTPHAAAAAPGKPLIRPRPTAPPRPPAAHRDTA